MKMLELGVETVGAEAKSVSFLTSAITRLSLSGATRSLGLNKSIFILWRMLGRNELCDDDEYSCPATDTLSKERPKPITKFAIPFIGNSLPNLQIISRI